MDIRLIRDIQNTHIIRDYTINNMENYELRAHGNKKCINYTRRDKYIDKLLTIFINRGKINQKFTMDAAYWRESETLVRLNKIYFFRNGKCTCNEICKCCDQKLNVCNHMKIKRELNKLALRKLKEIGLADIIFSFLL